MAGKYSRDRSGSPPSRSSADYIRSGKTPPRKKPRYRRRRRLNPRFVFLCTLVLVLLIVLISCIARPKEQDEKPSGGNSWFAPKETEAPTDPPTEPKMEITHTAAISATGDVLMHMPVIDSCRTADGSYDFTGIFRYLDDYAAAADYAAANLETTLAGINDGYRYSGYPCFNCPDEIADALKAAGFDMLLTANNHCYDTSTFGLTRTLQAAAKAGLDTLGTQPDAETADYVVETLNGIKVGMMCYSYATSDSYPDRPSMNFNLFKTDAVGMVSYFDYDQLDKFYAEVSDSIADMEAAGAEATVMYIHWGDEYQLSPNANQTAIAQKLCDLGIDVIVGGHPHVVQPVELLTNTEDETHKTVCLYSMGNAISNQQRQNMRMNTGHTEDGVLFSFRFARYSDGEVLLDSVEILPTWVYMDTTGSSRTYQILPLDAEITDWAAAFEVSESVAASAKASYDRTMALVGDGIAASQEYLDARREAKLAEPLT